MAAVTLQGYIIVPDDDLENITSALLTHIILTREEPGCLAFNVTPDKNNPNKFDVYEEFINQAGFNYHQSRSKASSWAETSKRVERHYEIIGNIRKLT